MNSAGWRQRAAPLLLVLLGAFVAITPEVATVVAQSARRGAASGDFAGRVDIGGGRKLYLQVVEAVRKPASWGPRRRGPGR
jgi:hypothetical protein